jgi:glycine oxidase
VTGLETSHGFVGSRTVVIAAGAWSSSLSTADKAGSELRIEPVRGQISCFQVQPRMARHVIYSPRGYVVPRRDGRLLAGSTSEFAGFSKEVTKAGLDSIRTHAAEIFEQISSLPLIDSWAGLRPKAPDGLPVLGPCAEIEGLFYATGHYRNGILLAPITGELLAEAIVERRVSSLLLPFSPNRFALAASQIS